MPYSEAEKRREYDRKRKAEQRQAAKASQTTAIAEKPKLLSPLAKEVILSPELIAFRRQRTREYEGNNFPKQPQFHCYKGEGLCLIRQSATSKFECACEPETCLLLVEISEKGDN